MGPTSMAVGEDARLGGLSLFLEPRRLLGEQCLRQRGRRGVELRVGHGLRTPPGDVDSQPGRFRADLNSRRRAYRRPSPTVVATLAMRKR